MIALGIRYLTGYAAATDATDRNRAEWPPHPGRLFMALVATWHETRPLESDPSESHAEWEEEGGALRWLERERPPALAASDSDPRAVVDVFVPPNDMNATKITIIPAFRSNKQPRTFPRTRPHRDTVHFIWPDAEPREAHLSALGRLASKLVRLGHSSSIVQAWLEEAERIPIPGWTPVESSAVSRPGAIRLRIFGPGTLNYLSERFGAETIARFHELSDALNLARGAKAAPLKAAFLDEFGLPWKKTLPPPESSRPVLSMTAEYARRQPVLLGPEVGLFDHRLLVLAKEEGPNLGLEATWRLLTALRGAIASFCSPTPEWVSGHQADGKPSTRHHLALLPLAFVGQQHADGHLLGVALAFPKEITLPERGQALGKLLYDSTGGPREIRLKLGPLGVWSLKLEERISPPKALQPETWTAHSEIWASFSPVVLDRHPRIDPMKNRTDWRTEVALIVAEACTRAGFPEPVEIDVDKTSWHRGAPRSKPGPGGFPLVPHKPGNPVRPQIHVWLRFDRPVAGPVVLGAGRFRGYGMCKPLAKGGDR